MVETPFRLGTSYAKSHAAIDDGEMSQQPADLMRRRDETIQLVQESLVSDRQEPSYPSSDPLIQSFWDIGTSIRSQGSPGTEQFSCSTCYVSLTSRFRIQ